MLAIVVVNVRPRPRPIGRPFLLTGSSPRCAAIIVSIAATHSTLASPTANIVLLQVIPGCRPYRRGIPPSSKSRSSSSFRQGCCSPLSLSPWLQQCVSLTFALGSPPESLSHRAATPSRIRVPASRLRFYASSNCGEDPSFAHPSSSPRCHPCARRAVVGPGTGVPVSAIVCTSFACMCGDRVRVPAR